MGGLEEQLLRVGGFSGRGGKDKAKALGIEICPPGWGKLSGGVEGGLAAGGTVEAGGAGTNGVLDIASEAVRHVSLHPPPSESAHPPESAPPPYLPLGTADLSGAFAISACAAHLLARVTSARFIPAEGPGCHPGGGGGSLPGHYLLTCETVEGFVKREYWSGKTFEPQGEGMQRAQPVLSFLGSQRFAHINPQERPRRDPQQSERKK